jgi:hypothetical protein
MTISFAIAMVIGPSAMPHGMVIIMQGSSAYKWKLCGTVSKYGMWGFMNLQPYGGENFSRQLFLHIVDYCVK